MAHADQRARKGRTGGPIDRPLSLGELLAETAHVYRERASAALGLGGVVAAALLSVSVVQATAGRVLIVALVFTGAYAAASRVAAGDRFAEAWAQTALRGPVLLALMVPVAVPFALGRFDPLLLFLAVFWLALTGFSIPVAMLERDPTAESALGRLGYSMRRSITLARVHFFHAAGVIAALMLIYILVGDLLARTLVGGADTGLFGAFLLVQVVLAPFFFLGLAVLYFDQRARALSSGGRS
jgi:hypothetical protein